MREPTGVGHPTIARIFIVWGLTGFVVMAVALVASLVTAREVVGFTRIDDWLDWVFAAGFALLLAVPIVRNAAVVVRQDGRTRALAAVTALALVGIYVVAFMVRSA